MEKSWLIKCDQHTNIKELEIKQSLRGSIENRIKNLNIEKLDKLLDLLFSLGVEECEDIKFVEDKVSESGFLTVVQLRKLLAPAQSEKESEAIFSSERDVADILSSLNDKGGQAIAEVIPSLSDSNNINGTDLNFNPAMNEDQQKDGNTVDSQSDNTPQILQTEDFTSGLKEDKLENLSSLRNEEKTELIEVTECYKHDADEDFYPYSSDLEDGEPDDVKSFSEKMTRESCDGDEGDSAIINETTTGEKVLQIVEADPSTYKEQFVRNLLDNLKLDKYHPNKLTFMEAITMRRGDKLDDHIGLQIIQQLLIGNHRAHLIELPRNDQADYHHPMDIMGVIYHCCDNVVLPILLSKIFISRLAIPLIMPEPISNSFLVPFGALRTIIPELKKGASEICQNLMDLDQTIVSFIRVSKLKRSKSKLLNGLFGDKQSDTFFHRDSVSGNEDRLISNGIVEMSCNLPSNGVACNFNNVFTVLNLRGEALEFKDQTKCISTVSSMIVIFTNENDLRRKEVISMINEFLNQQIIIIIAIICDRIPNEKSFLETLDSSGIIQDSVVRDWENNRRFNEDKLQKSLVNKINGSFSKLKMRQLKCIANVDQVRVTIIDTFSEDIAKKVEELLKPVHFIESHLRREELLPLQTKIWPEIAKLLRSAKLHDATEKSVAESEGKVKILRREQLEMYQFHKCFIKNFINYINEANLLLVLTALKFELNYISRHSLTHLKNELLNKPHEENKNNNLQEFDKNMLQASFGLEHIVREFGQVFEGYQATKKTNDKNVSRLPELAAKMLLAGFPVELMDGDNSFVSTDWVNAVITELTKIVGERKRFIVVSVVGIQSSGKSSMLNTMFGLQLAVSDGRCTKGVFCSLVPIDKMLSPLQADFVMVIDTEGLRAPELDKNIRNHDNELATFAIGLGNVAIINIKGENFSEMQDILEIVIHALIRINKTNSNRRKPKCIFVHQNVTGLNVESELESHRKLLKAKLDKITQLAAEKEKDYTVNDFNDIVSLDVSNVFYVPDMWHGSRPMAYISDGYINAIENIKQASFCSLNNTTLNNFRYRINDLWKALLSQDFVFSFRNSEELYAFEKLDKMMAEILWETKVMCIKVMEKTTIELRNSNGDEIVGQKHDLEMRASSQYDGFKNNALSKLREFLEKGDERHVLIHWQNRSEQNIKDFIENEKQGTLLALNKACIFKQIEMSNKLVLQKYETEFVKIAQEKAIQLRNSKHEGNLNNYFEKLWQKFVNNLSNNPSDSGEDWIWLKKTFVKHSGPFFPSGINLLDKISKSLSERTNVFDGVVTSKDIMTFAEIKASNKNAFNKYCFKIINFVTGSISKKELQRDADQLCREKMYGILTNVRKHFGQRINELIIKTIVFDEVEKMFNEERQYIFTDRFKEKFVLNIIQSTIVEFKQIQDQYRMESDMVSKIQKEKSLYFKLFMDTFENQKTDFIAANQLYSIVVEWLVSSITRNMSHLIHENVRNRHHCFQSKKDFLREVQCRLLHEESFKNYQCFVRRQNNFLIKMIDEIILETLDKRDENQTTLFESIIVRKIEYYKTKLIDAFDEACKKSQDPEDILQSLKCSFQNELLFAHSNETLRNLKITDLTSFKQIFVSSLTGLLNDCKSKIFENKQLIHNRKSAYFDGKSPGDILAEVIIGCKERCPFCSNICELTCSGHAGDHRCFSHFPNGVNGVHEVETKRLITLNCSSGVDSDTIYRYPVIEGKADGLTYYPYKNYNFFYPDWNIPADKSMESSLYWKRVMAKYNCDFAKFYDLQPANIPKEWNEITVEEAEKSLKNP